MAATNHELELQYFRETLESFDGYAQYHVRLWDAQIHTTEPVAKSNRMITMPYYPLLFLTPSSYQPTMRVG